MVVVLFVNIRNYEAHSLLMVTRNFYGALRVTESKTIGRPCRILFHGTIEHGAQFLLPPMRRWPITYYETDSGVGLALRYCCPAQKRVGVVGLGDRHNRSVWKSRRLLSVLRNQSGKWCEIARNQSSLSSAKAMRK